MRRGIFPGCWYGILVEDHKDIAARDESLTYLVFFAADGAVHWIRAGMLFGDSHENDG